MPVVWRLSEKRKLASLQEFSDTELDSGWQSLFALTQIDDPKAKAELFEHCIDEFYHADAFANLLNSYAKSPLNRPAFSREAILGSKASREAVLDFLVQVYVGEREINRDFAVYSGTSIDRPIRDLFHSIKKEEEDHEEVSWDLLLRYADGNKWKVRFLLLKKTMQHSYQRYVNFSQAFGEAMLSLVLSAIYFVSGLLFSRPLQKRLKLDRKEQLNILQQQLASIPTAKRLQK